MTTKIDLKKELKHLYHPSPKQPVIVEVPPMNYLMVDGKGDPGTSQAFKDAVSSLFPLAYALKFAVKKQQGTDYVVMPLQGLWWIEDMSKFQQASRDDWQWTAMIMQPEYVTAALVEQIRPEVEKKKNPPALAKIRFKSYHEGLAVQLMHIGPFAEEGPNIERMHAFAIQQGYQLHGKHHEIYLSNLERTAPDKLKTVLRQPITQ
ncbi:MAG: GyrI-like domain-containing protein [Anaerolineae bacterium]|nr:GyrI-like domain-containing protein [Anaerolineae bacterium]